MDYVEDTIATLDNVKNNPYGIKDKYHALKRSQKRSIDLNTVNTKICFDENFLPVNLEIVSASKIVGIEKKYLINPNGHVEIIIGNDIIKVEVTFKLKDENECVQLTALNDYGFPTSQTNFAIV